MTTELKRSDFSKICRTCLLQKDNMEPIYKSDIPKMLLSFTNIKVEPADDLPKLVCSECINHITSAYIFKEKCELNNEALLEVCSHQEEKSVVREQVEDSLEEDDAASHHADETIKVEEEVEDPKGITVEDEQKVFAEECDECGKAFEDAAGLRKHRLTHGRKPAFGCSLCDSVFKYSWNLNRHVAHFHGAPRRRSVCAVCGKAVVQLQQHMTHVHSVERTHQCAECSARFVSAHVLKQHVRSKHRGLRAFRLCGVCGKKCDSMKTLEIHMRSHTGETPYQCSDCHKRYKCVSALNVHRRLHTGERPFACTVCGKAFGASQTLKRHARIHTGERPFVCTVCNKAFSQKSVLTTHMTVHKSILTS